MFVPESVAPLVGMFSVTQRTVVLAMTTLKLAGLDSERIAIIFSNIATSQVRIGINPAIIAAGGGLTLAQSDNLPLDFKSFGALVNQEFYGVSGAGATVTITEISYRPK